MKVRDVMKKQAVCCVLDTCLGAAVELMHKNGCGFLPVLGEGGNVVGVITDRDICVALGTRNRKPSDLPVKDVMLLKQYTFPRLFVCTPDDEIHGILGVMRMERIRRMPVVDGEGSLMGILSLDDIALRACEHAGKYDISCQDVVDTYRAICSRPRRRPDSLAA